MNVIKLIPITVGPWGTDSSKTFEFNKEGDAIIRKVIIQYGDVIDSLLIVSESNGSTKTSGPYGGPGGAAATLSLDSIGDIVKIQGAYGLYQNKMVIKALSFVTSSKTYGPYGSADVEAKGTPFEMPTQGGKIVGFHGKYGDFLTSIGAYMVCAHI